MANLFAKRVAAQLKKAERMDYPNLLFYLDESNIHNVYVLVVGLPYPYLEGEYIFRLQLNSNFPDTPPELRCRTDNGVYMVGGKICISVGEFHAQDRKDIGAANAQGGHWGWRRQLGIHGFAREVLNGLIDPSILNGVKHPDSGQGGIGILDEPAEVRASLAGRSFSYNMTHNAALRAKFYEYAVTRTDLAASESWLAQLSARELRLAPDHQVISRAMISSALGDDISSIIPDSHCDLARGLCAVDPDYRRVIALCSLCPESELAAHAAEGASFLSGARDKIAKAAAAATGNPVALGALRKSVILAIMCNMRLNFAKRDEIVCGLA